MEPVYVAFDPSNPVIRVAIESSWMDQAVFGFTLIMVVFAGIAIGLSWWSVRATRKAVQGQLFLEISKRYSSDDMAKSLGTIYEIKDLIKSNPDWLENYARDRKQGATIALENDRCRRMVVHFFHDVLEIYDLKYIDKSILHRLCEYSSFDLMYSVLEHMNAVAFPEDYAKGRESYSQLLAKSGKPDKEKKELESIRPALP